MNKIDCIVLGGGNLVIGEGKRSNKIKGGEILDGRSLGTYILEILSKQKDRINNIIYIGDNLSDEVNGYITYANASKGKSFLKSLKIGVDTLKLIKGTKSKVILVICGDLPLIGEEQIDFILNNRPKGNNYLTIFGVDNKNLQKDYPEYNSKKRYLEIEEQNLIFGNAFLVKKNELEECTTRLQCIDDNGLKVKKIIKFALHIKVQDIILGLKLVIFGNIKLFDGKLFTFLKKIFKKVSEKELILLIESVIGKKGVKLVNNTPNELVIDYDRLYQKGFFDKLLKILNLKKN